ncbi:GH92 family glycosyl hydrolase [uncultured Sunxiuqinia sp.]|uniref:GH92 family glycosyl hydrolase n=1 Tax=uncultured Sunxiuqinia sp. TaxID=1573825 RepID=UPI002AA8FD1C|nr:GH92 family glycosyl hydrolase [uncultured Sunxiuqinia sp.]
MKKQCITSVLFLFVSVQLLASSGWLDYVDPNIGTTHSRWFFYTPGAVPFGMAKMGPSTNGSYGNLNGWEAVGYEDQHNSIEGFACFHEFQVGGILLQPIIGELKTKPGTLENPAEGFRSVFDKKDEKATAGYYSVLLKDYQVKVELTATKRVGFQRYTFPKSDDARILFDVGNQLGESGKIIDAYVEMVDKNTVQGYVVTKPEYVKKYQPEAEVKMFFYAEIDKKAESCNTFLRGGEISKESKIQGVGACLALNFQTKTNEPITVKIGQSYTSIKNAKLNLETEAKDLNFDKAKKQASAVWNEYLNRIHVEGGTEAEKTKFYTGLYHALLGRGVASDVNGAYPMNNGEIGHIELDEKGTPTFNYYNTDAIWGAFWNLTQLWSIAYPEYYSDWVKSQLLVYKETGWLGDGMANSKYVSGVGTNFTGLAIAAAYNCGIRDFDVELGYEAVLKNELEWRNRLEGAGKVDVGQFVEKGYVPYIDNIGYGTIAIGSGFAASHTLEYSFSSFAAAQFAKLLHKDADYRQLSELAKGWKLLYDPETKLIRPKTGDGEFIKNFDPLAPWVGFQEGNAVQYTFYVPHDIEELVESVGHDVFNTRLDSIFIISKPNGFGGGKTVHAFAGVGTPYNHGNQPNLHISWLFNFSGKPYLSQKWVREILNDFYGIDGLHGYGYGQDEDQGQLGAWYVMSSMGLFDVKGLTEINPKFQIGSPLFDRITIQLNRDYYTGQKFVIETKNNSADNSYIETITLNGKKQDSILIPFREVVNGGKLVIELNSSPNLKLEK